MKRERAIDLLRGIAVLLVIFHHLEATHPILKLLQNGGWVGVDLFFVLSGFLVSGLLFKQHQKEGQIRPINFLVRRAFKIYPAFWVFLAVSAAIFIGAERFWPRFWNEALFITNYTYDDKLWRHTWSLAVEEHFYILLPILLISIQAEKFQSLPRIVLMVCVGVFICKCLNYFRPFSFGTHYTPTHLRIDALLFGVLLSYWFHYWPEFKGYCKSRSVALVTLGVALFVPAFVTPIDHNPVVTSLWLTPLYLGSGMILMGVLNGVPDNHTTRSLGFVGRHSYGIYLWHVLVTETLWHYGIQNDAVVWIAQALSVAIGVLMSELVELPMLRIREWITTKSPASL